MNLEGSRGLIVILQGDGGVMGRMAFEGKIRTEKWKGGRGFLR